MTAVNPKHALHNARLVSEWAAGSINRIDACDGSNAGRVGQCNEPGDLATARVSCKTKPFRSGVKAGDFAQVSGQSFNNLSSQFRFDSGRWISQQRSDARFIHLWCHDDEAVAGKMAEDVIVGGVARHKAVMKDNYQVLARRFGCMDPQCGRRIVVTAIDVDRENRQIADLVGIAMRDIRLGSRGCGGFYPIGVMKSCAWAGFNAPD